MAGKGGKLTIEGGTNEGGNVYLNISDTGVGISRQFIEEKLFHAFATTKRKGMGLGLYTCREVVQAHGGTIEVQSKQGAGTTFSVVLPSTPSSKSVSKMERKVIGSQS
jgi:signal transduction histidine kinase